MPADRDDDALSWDDGTDDPTYAAAAGGREVEAAVEAPGAVHTPATGSALLVFYGVIAGGYLLSTIGWVVAALRDTFDPGALISEVLYQLGQFLAIAAPVLWFASTLLLTRERRSIVRVVWLLVGLVLLVPWPFVLSGGTL